MDKSRYRMFMDKVDRWTRLLGTTLVKVSFIDENTGFLVKENQGGQVQLDVMHGGVYDLKHGASPYYITELLIGFGAKFGGFRDNPGYSNVLGSNSLGANVPSPSKLGANDIEYVQSQVDHPGKLNTINRIYWDLSSHEQIDEKGNSYKTSNPYGLIPAVPFFNQDPAHYYFLPINEPLIYANHAVNMRITDLNHIAKFQSFGVPVVSGIERPTSLRQGRPTDDFNVLRGGNAQSRFGGIAGIGGFGSGGNFRNFDSGLGIFRDGNAEAAALGITLGPDTAVAVGEKGDFKFAHPNADIKGLVYVIQNICDMVRINHGLRPKFQQDLPASGYAQMLEKMGVIEENRRRGRLFKEREQQLFQVIKRLWNTHYSKSGEKKFSENAKLEVTYVEPKFPVDPKTNMETMLMESAVMDTGNRDHVSKLYPHLTDKEVGKKIDKYREGKAEQHEHDLKLAEERERRLYEAAPDRKAAAEAKAQTPGIAKPKIDNRAKHAEDSSKQPGKNGDLRK